MYQIVGQRAAVIRLRRHEVHVGADIIVPAQAVLALAAGDAGFAQDAVAHLEFLHARADLRDRAGKLVAEADLLVGILGRDEGPAFKAVDVGTADADILHLDLHLIVRRLRHGRFLNFHQSRRDQDRFRILHSFSSRSGK